MSAMWQPVMVRRCAVQGDAALLAEHPDRRGCRARSSVSVVRHLDSQRLRERPVAERDDVAGAVAVRLEFEEHQPPCCARRRRSASAGELFGDRSFAATARRPAETARRLWREPASAAVRNVTTCRRSPGRQHEVADVGGAALEQDGVTRPRAVQRAPAGFLMRERSRVVRRGRPSRRVRGRRRRAAKSRHGARLNLEQTRCRAKRSPPS